MYGGSPNPHATEVTGKLTGPGTHFGQAKEEPATTGNDIAVASTLAPSSVNPDDGESTASIKSGVQGYPQSSNELTCTSGTFPEHP